jgi:PAS domain S-box-containing protein
MKNPDISLIEVNIDNMTENQHIIRDEIKGIVRKTGEIDHPEYDSHKSIIIKRLDLTLGYVKVYMSLKARNNIVIDRIRLVIYLQFFVLIILILSTTLILNKAITKPFKKILFAFESLTYGDYDFEIKAKKSDAIGEVIEHLNEAKRALKSHISELKQTNDQLHQEIQEREIAEKQTEIFKKFAESSSQGFGMASLEGIIMYQNFALNDLLGVPKDENMIGENILSVYPEDEVNRLKSIIPEVLKKGEFSFESKVLCHGKIVPIHQSIFVIYNDEKPHCLATIITDITDRIEQQNTLELAKHNAESSNLLKSEFPANMSHELRTPLHEILAYANFGAEKTGNIENKKIIEYFSNIKKSGGRLLLLVNNLLDLSKLEAGKTEYKLEKQSLHLIVASSLQNFIIIAGERRVKFNYEIPKFDNSLLCDKNKLIQVITNILSNSVKYSHRDSTVDIKLENELNSILVTIDDEGVGIPPKELESIFDKFVQSSKSKSEGGGTGLGLSISKQIVSDHKGVIWAENRFPRGSSFKIRLPKRW